MLRINNNHKYIKYLFAFLYLFPIRVYSLVHNLEAILSLLPPSNILI